MEENGGNSDKKTFHLTAKQRSKLTGESELGDSPGTTLKDIRQKKVERLPERINRLFSELLFSPMPHFLLMTGMLMLGTESNLIKVTGTIGSGNLT